MKENNTMETYKLILTEEQLGIVKTALEAYSRIKMGQVGYGLQEIFPWMYSDDADTVERSVRNLMNFLSIQRNKEPPFPDNSSSYWGYGHEKVGDGSEAFVIMQAIRQFLGVKANDGYFDSMYVTYDDPMTFGREGKHVPQIEEFIKYKDFYIDDEESRTNGIRSDAGKLAIDLYKEENWNRLFAEIFNDEFFKKHNVRGDKYEILIDRFLENCFIRVYRPNKLVK
jgi:hypothetical protein